jgi:hypothetical protein
MFTGAPFFSFSDQILQRLPNFCITVAILHMFMILQMLSPFIVLLFLCPGANAMKNQQAFPDVSFKLFNDFIAQNFSSKITLATVQDMPAHLDSSLQPLRMLCDMLNTR